jgi:hypothetical protein
LKNDHPPLLRFEPWYGWTGVLLTAVIDGLLLGAAAVVLCGG